MSQDQENHMIKLYAIKDKASSTTQAPFPVQCDRDAVDGFKALVNDNKTSIGKHPEDFELYHLGEYNPRLMAFSLNNDPKFIISAQELKQ